MTKFKVVLSYDDIDIEDFDQLEAIAAEAPFADLVSVDGALRVLASIEASDATEAVETLVDAIHRAHPTAVPLRAELQLVTIPDIADQLGLNRETVRLWTVGKRGPGGFPTPVDVVGDRIKVWAASDVHVWLTATGIDLQAGRPLSMDDVLESRHAIERRRRAWEGRRNIEPVWHVADSSESTVDLVQPSYSA